MTNEQRQEFLQSNLSLDEIRLRYGLSESTPENLSKDLGLPIEPLRAIHEYYYSGTLEPPPRELLVQLQSLVKIAVEKRGTDAERQLCRTSRWAVSQIANSIIAALTHANASSAVIETKAAGENLIRLHEGLLVLRALWFRMLTLQLP
jgi:hypothetical protein